MVTKYMASLPAWLSFNGNNSQQIFWGVPAYNDVDKFVVVLTCYGGCPLCPCCCYTHRDLVGG